MQITVSYAFQVSINSLPALCNRGVAMFAFESSHDFLSDETGIVEVYLFCQFSYCESNSTHLDF